MLAHAIQTQKHSCVFIEIIWIKTYGSRSWLCWTAVEPLLFLHYHLTKQWLWYCAPIVLRENRIEISFLKFFSLNLQHFIDVSIHFYLNNLNSLRCTFWRTILDSQESTWNGVRSSACSIDLVAPYVKAPCGSVLCIGLRLISADPVLDLAACSHPHCKLIHCPDVGINAKWMTVCLIERCHWTEVEGGQPAAADSFSQALLRS